MFSQAFVILFTGGGDLPLEGGMSAFGGKVSAYGVRVSAFGGWFALEGGLPLEGGLHGRGSACRGQHPPNTQPRYGQPVVAIHPTGMHTCLQIVL